ncbi:hypothetical protein Rsub_06070 [Raphidocelis subcapitata]|uniref:FIST C-domain domain-containing protein n=1 Tax=Raphidocelis subcapitata TaxID=307507 RepID=A0A2V0P1I9_9CHLO|nr:hypothetical protein Rsub_06070 [Raphidocelis subcapitata]|eukprot:GBF93738.1 hypothetical protein Rsub_06070 [Raphidocelis subcapitata]
MRSCHMRRAQAAARRPGTRVDVRSTCRAVRGGGIRGRTPPAAARTAGSRGAPGPSWRCAAGPREAPPPAGGASSAAPGPAGGASGGGAAANGGWGFASALSRRVNLDLAVAEAAEAALKSLGQAEPDVAFVWASSAYGQALDLAVPLARRLLPSVRVILGCTGFGVCGGSPEDGRPEEVEHGPALSVALAALPGVELALKHVQPQELPDGDAPPSEWARAIGVPLDAPGGAGAGGGGGDSGAAPTETHFVVIADPTFSGIEELLAGLDFAYPAAKKIGGLTSSGRLSSARSIFCWAAADQRPADDTGVRRSGAAVLALRGPLTMELLIAQGCRPLSRRMYEVASLAPQQRNMVASLAEVNGSGGGGGGGSGAMPPVDALRRDLSDPLQPIDSERELARVVSNLCCGLAPDDPLRAAAATAAPGDAEPQDWLIRGMALTNTAQLAVGDELRVGQRLRFMVRDREGAQADLEAHGVAYKRRQLAAALEGRPAPPALGALMFSCNGRGLGLYGEESYDSRQLAGYVGAPVSGFQCNGEIGSVAGSTKLHGFTCAVAVLRPTGPRPSSSDGDTGGGGTGGGGTSGGGGTGGGA